MAMKLVETILTRSRRFRNGILAVGATTIVAIGVVSGQDFLPGRDTSSNQPTSSRSESGIFPIRNPGGFAKPNQQPRREPSRQPEGLEPIRSLGQRRPAGSTMTKTNALPSRATAQQPQLKNYYNELFGSKSRRPKASGSTPPSSLGSSTRNKTHTGVVPAGYDAQPRRRTQATPIPGKTNYLFADEAAPIEQPQRIPKLSELDRVVPADFATPVADNSRGPVRTADASANDESALQPLPQRRSLPSQDRLSRELSKIESASRNRQDRSLQSNPLAELEREESAQDQLTRINAMRREFQALSRIKPKSGVVQTVHEEPAQPPKQLRPTQEPAAKPVAKTPPRQVRTADFQQIDQQKESKIEQVDYRTAPRYTSSKTLLESGSSEPQTAAVTLEWTNRTAINVGQTCQCDLVVRNVGNAIAYRVNVEAGFPESVELQSVKPEPNGDAGKLTWSIPALAPKEIRVFEFSIVPHARGALETSANVTFTGAADGLFQVEEPMLQMAVDGPSRVLQGEPATQTVTLSNPGTGIAENIMLQVSVPEGLKHPQGKRLLMEVGSLNPGESRVIRVALAAIRGGSQTVEIVAQAEGGLQERSAATVEVIAPSLKVAVDGPGLRYLGRSATYKFAVTNEGSATTGNVRIVHEVPEGFDFVEASSGGKYDPTTRSITWFLGALEPSRTIPIAVSLDAAELGEFEHRIQAITEHGIVADSTVTTRVEGTASLVLEIIDLDDPVEVGAETAYEVRVQNHGSMAAQGVALSCELPAGVVLVSAKGPTPHLVNGDQVQFKAIGALSPGNTAIYRVHVRGKVEGNHRFRAHLASDSIQEPLVFEELTKFYAD